MRWIAKRASKVDGFISLSDEAAAMDQKNAMFAEYEPEEQKLALAAGMCRVPYWEDWIHSHNHTVKGNLLRGAEVKHINQKLLLEGSCFM